MFDHLFNLFEEDGNPRDYYQQMAQQGRILPPQQASVHSGLELEFLMERVADACEGLSSDDLYPVMLPFYRALTQTIVIVPCPNIPIGPELNTVEPYQLPTILSPNGEKSLPVFTSEDALQAWILEPIEYFAIPFRIICTKALEQGVDAIVINDAGPARAELTAFELSYLSEGLIPPYASQSHQGVTLDENTEITLSALSRSVPVMLAERLNGYFNQGSQSIYSAYLFEISIAHGPIHLAMAVKMNEKHEALWETNVLPDLMAISRETLERNDYIDFFLLNDTSDLSQSVQEVIEPYFKS